MFGITNRRHFMQHAMGMGALGLPAFDFFSKLQAATGPVASKKRDHKSMIIIWMNGGAAVKDFFDLKPGHVNNHAKEAKTAVSGISINETPAENREADEELRHRSLEHANRRRSQSRHDPDCDRPYAEPAFRMAVARLDALFI